MTKKFWKAIVKRKKPANSFDPTRGKETCALKFLLKIGRLTMLCVIQKLSMAVEPSFSNMIRSSSSTTVLNSCIVESNEGIVTEFLNNYSVNSSTRIATTNKDILLSL